MNNRPIVAIHPTTPAQQGFVFATLTNPSDALFVEQVVVPLKGPVNCERFDAAVDELVARHEILRTAFIWDVSDAPRQVVLDVAGVRIPVEHRDLSDGSAADTVVQILARHRDEPFDPAKPPLLRLALLSRAPQEHLLVWSNHHLILDGWSQLALVQELMRLYDGTVPLPAPIQFGLYARWLARRDLARDRNFWRDHFRGYTPREPLAVRPAPEDARFGTREAIADDRVEAGLHFIAQLAGVTAATVVNAFWLMAMSRLIDTGDVVIGLSVAGRPAEFEYAPQMAGPFAVTLPFRAQLDWTRPVVSWLLDLHPNIAKVIAHDEGVVRDLAEVIGQRTDRPAYDSIVAYSNYPVEQPGEAGRVLTADVTNAAAYGGRTNHALTLVVYQLKERRFRLVNDRTRVPDDTAAEVLDAVLDSLREATSWDNNTRLGEVLPGLKIRALARTEPRPAAASSITADIGHAEMVVANIYRNLLGLPSCHPDEDFIQLGGHSLLALKLLDALKQAFSVDLTMSDVLRARTPRGMASRIRELLGVARVEMERLPQVVAQPLEATEPFPMTQIQQAYWVGRQAGFDLNGVDSHLYGEVDIPDLNVARFERAWATLINRHSMLRAVATSEGQMRVLPEVPDYRVAVTDLRGSTAAEEDCIQIRERLSHVRRDTAQWPLFTIEAAQLPGAVTRLFLSFDLLIGDAHSWRVLYRELVSLYDQPGQALPTIDITFRDYVLASSAMRETTSYAKAREYWHERIAQLPPPPELPMVRPPDAGRPHRFSRRQLLLPAEDVAKLRRCAGDLGVTVSVLLLGVFAEVLEHFTGSQRFLINVTVFNRLPLHPHVDSLVGDFTSLLLEEVNQTIAPTVAERVRALQRQMWIDLDHRLYSGLEVLRDIGERDGRRTSAVAPVVFTSTVENSPSPVSDEEPLRGKIVYAIGQTPQVLFDYQTYLLDGQLVINWDTVDELFPEGYLDDMFATHSDALNHVLRDPDTLLGKRIIKPPVAAALEPVATDYQLLHDPFLDHARMAPDNVAVVSSDRRLTYRETLLQAIHVAHRIRAAGGDGLVMIYMEKGWEQVVGALGVLLAGRAFMPADAGWPASRVESYASFGDCQIILTQPRLAKRCAFGPEVQIICVEYEGGATDCEILANDATGTDLAYVIFTSGSTGKPKGVMIEHRSALNTILDVNLRYAVDADDSVLAISPLAFDLSIYDIFGLLAAGGKVILPLESKRRDPSGWLDLIREEMISIWNSVPVLMDLLAAHSSDIPDALGSLRLCLLSGDWIPLYLPDEVRRQAPRARVVSLGGATEGSIWSILYDIDKVEPTWSSVPYGRSMSGQRVQVLAADRTPAPAWVPGEIFISGVGLARGYWAAPELTEAAFIVDERTGTRLYRTGDWGRLLPGGDIEFLGRRDGQVKIGGHRVELREIERAVEQIDGVDQAVVVAPGTGIARRLVGYVVGRRTEAEVRDALSAVLPSYMVPVQFVRLEELPLSVTGKVDRSALLARADSAEIVAAPADVKRDIGRDLSDVVARFVGVGVAADTDLLQLGMNSIDVIRLCNAIDAAFGARPDVEAFYRDPTLRGLASLLPTLVTSSPHGALADGRRLDTWIGHVRLDDPDERTAFRSTRPRPVFEATDGILPATRPHDMQRRRERRTPTSFSSEPVSLEQLGALLESLRRVEIEGRARHLYPSAGGLYSVHAYLYAAPDRVTGLREGIYYYHPKRHDLVTVAADLILLPSLHAGMVNRKTVDDAAFTLFLIADPTDYGPLYGADARHLALLDAGYMGQLLCEAARPIALELCPMHGYQFDRVRWVFPAGDRVSLLHLLVGGRPREEDLRSAVEGK